MATKLDKTGPVLPVDKFQDRLGDVARVFWVTGGYIREFNIPLDHNTYGTPFGCVRLYLPGLSLAHRDPPSRHTCWAEQRILSEYATPELFMVEVAKDLRERADMLAKRKRQLTRQEAEALLFNKAPEPTRPILRLRAQPAQTS